jgi:asparagine synthase (glutamine-hydrolysing)
VLRRPKKGFSTPIDQWFRGSLTPFVRETLLGEQAAGRQLFDLAVVERLIEEHAVGRHNHQRLLFSLVSFELWHRQFVQRRLPSGDQVAATTAA